MPISRIACGIIMAVITHPDFEVLLCQTLDKVTKYSNKGLEEKLSRHDDASSRWLRAAKRLNPS